MDALLYTRSPRRSRLISTTLCVTAWSCPPALCVPAAPDVIIKAFEMAGYTAQDVEEKFGALFNAFHYGAPPHAGMAPGVNRLIMLLRDGTTFAR